MQQIQWFDEVIKRKEQLLAQCEQLLSIPSILDETTAKDEAPFGEKIAEALQYMLNLGKQDGFVTKDLDGYAGHIEMGTGDQLIGILSHIDVVPTGEGWTSPPFSPEIRDGKLFARGAVDDKGPTLAAYFALKIIKDLGLPLSKRVRLILGTDEETTWRCMKHYFSHEEMPTMGFTPDAYFPLIVGEKGMISFCLTGLLEEVKEDEEWVLAEFHSGVRVNLVPDEVVVRLKGKGDVFSLKEQFQDYLLEHQLFGFAEESDEELTLRLQGVAHHAFEPDHGLNAGLAMARFLNQIELDRQGARYIQLVHDCFVDSFYGERLGIEQAEERLGRLTVNAGVFRYQSGNEQQLFVNIRYPLTATLETVVQQIEKVTAVYGVQLTNIEHLPAFYLDVDHPLISTLATVYEDQMGESAQLLTMGGATFARILDTGIAFGPVFPGKEETAHQRDEYIEIEDLLRATAIYAQAIYELARA